MIALLVITDGRQRCIERTLQSARQSLLGPITRMVVIDDSADKTYAKWLDELAGDFATVAHHPKRAGFGGAIQSGWLHLYDAPERYVFHLEDDFTFNHVVNLFGMMDVLDREPDLVQLALRRQPWNDEERAAGGIVEQHPNDYRERAYGTHRWLEHRRFFTTNPSLYRRSLCARGWPQVERSEGAFTHDLLRDPGLRFGFWGPRDSGEWVTHIGDERVGVGY